MSQIKSVEVIFKRSLADVVRNLFVPKAKRFPRVATFTGFSGFYLYDDQSIHLEFGNVSYNYPSHKIGRIKIVRH